MKAKVATRKTKAHRPTQTINLSKWTCPLCGKRRSQTFRLSNMLQTAWTVGIGLLRVCIMILLLILIGAALVR